MAGSAARIAVQWLSYGSTAHLAAYASSLTHHHHGTASGSAVVGPAVDLIVLLVRMSDLEAAHPELASSSMTGSSSSILDQLVTDLVSYDTIIEQLPPLMLVMTPSPPDQQRKFLEAEMAFLQRVKTQCTTSQRIHWRPSSHLMELFRAHNETNSSFYDRKANQLKHAPYTQRMLNTLALELCRQSCRLLRTPASKKKVIVLDCDNTLWGGAVAELGVDGIALTEPFLDLQRFVVRQQQTGMLLCLCSKNVESDVVTVFQQRRNDMVLKLKEHVVLLKVNWEDKSSNIEAITRELSLGLDAFVFIDDNPVECSEVASKLPMVAVINVPSVDAGFAPGFLDREWVFDEPIGGVGTGNKVNTSQPTQEDSKRTLLYQHNLQRNKIMEAAGSHKAFLSSLGVKIVFEVLTLREQREASELLIDNGAASSSFSRVLQLHQRTNQFNIATSFSRALMHDKLAAYAAVPSAPLSSSKAICAHVTDRFGHYGLVSVILCHLIDTETSSAARTRLLQVDSFLLSCRALNRGVEHAMVRKVAELAENLGAHMIEFFWEPTDRNEPARLFFSSLQGFAFKPAKLKGDNATEERRQGAVTSRDEKLRLSAKSKGTWTIDACKATQVAFFKVKEARDANEEAEPKVNPASQLLHHSPAASMARLLSRLVSAITRVMRAVLVKIAMRILPKWLVAFIRVRLRIYSKPNAQELTVQPYEVGLRLCQSFRELHSLNAFISSHTMLLQHEEEGNGTDLDPSATTTDAADSDDAALDTQEASKFRRKARHQTKLALLDHLNEDNPDVIWSANRKSDQSTSGEQDRTIAQQSLDSDAAAGDSSEVLILQQHRPCSTSQCDATFQLQSQCTFQRCRTCCYKIQRLIARLGQNAHEKAKQTAIEALAEQFNVALDASAGADTAEKPGGQCPAHKNVRRRQAN